MENLKLLNYQDAKELIKIFCNPVDEGKKFWVNSLIHSINFEYETLTPEMINEYNDLITLFKNLLPDMEINKETRDKFENVLNNCKKKEIKNEINTIKESTYTTTQAKAIKKYRQSEKGAIKNRELSKKYYEERKDIPEIKEKVKEAHKTSYSKLKEDEERYKLYLERKKELYHLRKEEQKKMEEINEEIKQKQKEKYPNIEETNPNISTEQTPEQKKEQVKMRRKGLKLLNEII